MKITPLEIRQKTFEKAFRGLDKDEVNAFILSLSHEWERMLDDNKNNRIKLEHAEKEVLKLREVESTLYKTLKTAEDTSANVIDQANRTANLHMKETQMSADGLMNEAKQQAKIFIENAEAKVRAVLEEMQSEVKELEENYRIIENQKDNMISQLKMLSGDVMEKVAKLNDRQAGMGIENHLKKVKEMLRETSERVIHDEKKTKLALDEVKKPAANKIKVEEPADAEINEEPKYEETEVKQNRIVGDDPIERKTVAEAKIPKKVMETVEKDDLSFFDQLED
ncbi:MAG: cell division initiation protein [Cyclobacteriaceae bacterium]|jgi:cell division initiation protein